MNTALPLADCCSITTVLAGKVALQVPLVDEPMITQLMPTGVLVTVPLPADPAPGATVSRCGAGVKPTLTALVTALTTDTVHVGPKQAPPNPSKLPFCVLPPISVTRLPASKLALQIPLVTPAVTVHAMPDGELVTAPLPVPLPEMVITPGCGMR